MTQIWSALEAVVGTSFAPPQISSYIAIVSDPTAVSVETSSGSSTAGLLPLLPLGERATTSTINSEESWLLSWKDSEVPHREVPWNSHQYDDHLHRKETIFEYAL